MPNRQWSYVVILAPKHDNKDKALQTTHEIKSTNALRAVNKAKKAHAEATGNAVTDFQVLDAYRDLG